MKFVLRKYANQPIFVFVDILIEKLENVNFTTKQMRNDADVLIIEPAIEESKHEWTAVILGILQNDFLLPKTTILPLEPDESLNTTYCKCNNVVHTASAEARSCNAL